ncbi:unnamed protein product [Prunus armeniaca]|uniref:Uncharacterized protein n=1 Tax=Prunus armeniaca TaxID=36596 RepID=A0A6J5UB92_PRUAR|nr:unnamed protein product [Prunus armeniaca]
MVIGCALDLFLKLHFLLVVWMIAQGIVDRKKAGSEMMIALVNNVSRILHSINAGGERLRGDKLTHANEVILKAELLFGDVTLHKMDVMKGLFISPLLLDLETITKALFMITLTASSF